MSRNRPNISAQESNLEDIIRLQLRKPRNWNWELSTSRSSPHIPLPVIQLYDDKKNLLVETKAYDRRSWHVSDYKNPRSSYPEKISTSTSLNYPKDKLKKRSTFSSSDFNRKLNVDEKIRIKEHILKKSRSEIFSSAKNNVTEDAGNSRKENVVRKTSLKTSDDAGDAFMKRYKEKYSDCNSDTYENRENRYILRTCNAGTLLVKKENKNYRRRRKTTDLSHNSSSSDSDKSKIRKENNTKMSTSTRNPRGISRRHTDLAIITELGGKLKNHSASDLTPKSKYKVTDLKYGTLENKLSSQKSDVFKRSQDTVTMGANFSRHSSKGLSGRRCQSISNICNSKDHYFDTSGREVDAAYKFCNSLPSPNGTAYNNNYEHKPLSKKTSLQHTVSEHMIDSDHPHPPNECHPLQWKFTETQTLCDQGYGSERSPEEEIPPPIPNHQDYPCDYTIDCCFSSYPFITPENTFEVELIKGSRGLGLSVCGGIDSDGSWPGLLRIKRLFPHQPAAASGFLAVGDLLLEANGVALTGLSNYEALEVLRMTPNKVVLVVCRPPPEVLCTMSPVPDAPPPPPRRASHKHTQNNYQQEFEIVLSKVHGSLGFTLCKEEEGVIGHYVRALVREPAISDGRIQPGDKIVAVNGIEISDLSHEQAVQFLRQCDTEVHLRLHREIDRTPVDLSPTETTPNSSFRPKPNLRQEAVDMLSDLAARKLSSNSPCTSPRHLRHVHDANTSYESLSTEGAHNAYELNNLDPEMLDAPNLNCVYDDGTDTQDSYPEQPVSMPQLPHHPLTHDPHFTHNKPTYQSAHPQVEFTSCAKVVPETVEKCECNHNMADNKMADVQMPEKKIPGPGTLKRRKDLVASDRDLAENDAQILNIELNRGWNSRLGFSLREVDSGGGGGSGSGACVSAVHPHSLAARDGRLQLGDCLLRVNDEVVENMKTSDVIDLLRIIRGPVCITVLRRKARLD